MRPVVDAPPSSRPVAARCRDTAHAKARRRLDELWARGARFLESDCAILGGAMSWLSDSRLVAAMCNAGMFGVLAAAAMPPDRLRAEIHATRHLTKRAFGVNLVTLHPAFQSLIDVCIETGVRHVFLGGGLPPGLAIDKLKQAGCRVVCFAPSLAVARRLIRSGADALILEGLEAGGHVGPVTTCVLAQEILPEIHDVPVFVAGGIGRGEAIAAFLMMGAAGCQLGTRFAAAAESPAHLRFKQVLIQAKAYDAVTSPQLDPAFKIIPVRALKNRAMKDFMTLQRELIDAVERGDIALAEAREKVEWYWAGRLKDGVLSGDTDRGSLMAGQSAQFVWRVQPVAEILAELVGQATEALTHVLDASGGERIAAQ